uniref:Uncharacterized protein n=1 Tax=Setaria digitata TaxID=48799 RepID=A0A915Q0Z1_9BILA
MGKVPHTVACNTGRTRTHLAVRYMFRVKPCYSCFALECFICILTSISIVYAYIFIGPKVAKLGILIKENSILNEQKNSLSYIDCEYKKPLEFSTVSCGEDEDQYAFISRLRESVTQNDRCVDRVDVAPSINISEHWGQVLRVKDFMIKCPTCATISYFGWRVKSNVEDGESESKRCAREIQTYSRGWPQHARFCDEEEMHAVEDFCRLHELLRAKLGVTMEKVTDLDISDTDISTLVGEPAQNQDNLS